MRNTDLVELQSALDAGADPETIFEQYHPGQFWGNETRLLHAAVESNWIDGVEALLKAGADPETRSTKLNATALWLVAHCEHPNLTMARLLIDHHADPEGLGHGLDWLRMSDDFIGRASSSEMTALRAAVQRPNLHLNKLLAEGMELRKARANYLAIEQVTAPAPLKSRVASRL